MSLTGSTLAALRTRLARWRLPLLWVLTRALVVAVLLGPHRWVTGDLRYFADSLARLGERGLEQTLVEYPLPGVALVGLPWLVVQALDVASAYPVTVVSLAVATDGAFTLLLHRFGAPEGRPEVRTRAVAAWVLAVPLLGATAYARFDLVPGVLAGGALLLLTRYPRVAAAGAAAATSLKLWPVLLLPALAAPRDLRRRVVAVAATVGVLLVVVSVLVGGWARLLSPLTWQSDRGLQIEAAAATPAMVGWALAPKRYEVAYMPSNAFEVTGPGVGVLLSVTDGLTLLLVAMLLRLWWRAWRRPQRDGGADATVVVWVSLFAVTGLVVTSKVLSPQYLLWLLPVAVVALALVPSRRMWRWVVVLMVATGLTQLVFPVLYAGLVDALPWSGWAVLVLAGRNLLLVWLTFAAGVAALRAVHRSVGAGDGGVSGGGRWSAIRPVRRARDDAPSDGARTTRQ